MKSMLGEALRSVDVTPAGLLGDRAYALLDPETGRVVSAKRPREWADLLRYEAAFVSDPEADAPVPHVRVTLPSGETHTTAAPDLNGVLSDALGRTVTLESSVPEGATFEYHWPDMEGLAWNGRPVRDEVTVHEMPPGTFFDSTSVLVLTSASLARMRALAPDNDFEAGRFRANMIIDPPDGVSGFVENDWAGRTLCVGDTVRLEITGPCMRCVMVNLPTGDLPANPTTLKTTFEHNRGNVGAKAVVSRPGHVRVGDPVTLL